MQSVRINERGFSMQNITAFFESLFNALPTISGWEIVWNIVDILIVAYLIYQVISLIRKTSSYNLAKGLLVLLIALFLSGVLQLTMINYLLRKAVEIGLIALVILFQPEIRRLLAKMGSRNLGGLFSSKKNDTTEIDAAIAQTVLACEEMSATKTGALIIFERGINLGGLMATGTVIDADITSELLKNIFYPKAPLHDGALIIRNSRIAAAGCVLPLTGNTNLSKDLGMRHRAGIGASEQSDAVVVIVSEETGAISVAIEGMLKRNLSREMFEKVLRNELAEDTEKSTAADVFGRFFDKRKVKSNEKEEK